MYEMKDLFFPCFGAAEKLERKKSRSFFNFFRIFPQKISRFF